MQVFKERLEDNIVSRIVYKDPEEFEKDLGNALWAAQQPNTVVEVRHGGDYYTFEYHLNKADQQE